MATKDTLQEDQNSFADSFNEDTPAPAEQSEDEAFGLNMPEADEVPDDNSGDNGDPALMIAIEAAPKEGEGESAAEDAAETPAEEAGESPAEQVAEGEPEMTQNDRTWEGRLKKREEELKAREEALKAREEGADNEAAEESAEGEGDGQVDDIEGMKSRLAEDFGQEFLDTIVAIAKSEASAVAGSHVDYIRNSVRDIINGINDDRARRHFETIHDAHPDFFEVSESPEFKEFVSNLPPTDRSEAERVIAAGSASEINALLTQFKQSAGAAGNDDALEAAEGVRSSGIRLPKPPAAADDDFVSAWNES